MECLLGISIGGSIGFVLAAFWLGRRPSESQEHYMLTAFIRDLEEGAYDARQGKTAENVSLRTAQERAYWYGYCTQQSKPLPTGAVYEVQCDCGS